MNRFERWRVAGIPAWLRAAFPSPFEVSRELLKAPTGAFESGARAVIGVGMAIFGALYVAVILALAVVLLLGPAGAFNAPGEVAVTMASAFMIGPLFGAGCMWAGSRVAGLHRPQVARIAALSVALPCALLPVAIAAESVAVGAVMAALAVVPVVLSLVAVRPRPTLGRVVERVTVYSVITAALLAAVGVVCAVGASVRWRGFGVMPAASFGRDQFLWLLAWAIGLGMLGVGVFILAVLRVDQHAWKAPETWLEGTLGPDKTITFANGVAPRRAADWFATYLGPVVVIPIVTRARGAFRGDGAPDDGWTVPGTLASVREAVASSRLAAHAMALFATSLATGTLLAVILVALSGG